MQDKTYDELKDLDMATDETDLERRRFLTLATSVIGGVGIGLASVPFISSWLPSAKAMALGAPVEVDVSKIEEGQKITVAWRGQPIFIVHRSAAAIGTLEGMTSSLRDPTSAESQQPQYTHNQHRSIREQILVIVGICTHLGCVPVYHPKKGSIEAAWQGGFFCPCHGSKYDMAGRVYKGVPAPANLPIPPHHYVNDKILIIGEDA